MASQAYWATIGQTNPSVSQRHYVRADNELSSSMCGIAAIFAYHPAAQPIDQDELRRIRDYMAARGPDGFGAWCDTDGRVGLGHRRLSIIDLSNRGAQPMQSADGKRVVTFNGEIYNYKELRDRLQVKGHVFETWSDTEVLLHLYAESGPDMVHELRGMYAFCLWDRDKRTLLLARDPYGIKPLYYADDGRTIRCASQVKALIAGGRISARPAPAGLVSFYLFGSVQEPFTIHQAIRAVPAGSTVQVNIRGVGEPRPYFSLASSYCRAEANPLRLRDSDLQEHCRAALLDSVRHHLVADVPVGAFLSGGVDSSSLVGLMRDTNQKDIQTITAAFDEFRGQPSDESPLAESVACSYGTRQTTRVFTEQEFREELPKFLQAMDQPTIDGLNTWFVSKAARELGLKVVISGLGGDELLGGYPSFRDLPRSVSLIAPVSRMPLVEKGFSQLIAGLNGRLLKLNPKVTGLMTYGGTYPGAYLLRRGLYLPSELGQLMPPEEAAEGLRLLQPLSHIAGTLEPTPSAAFSKVATLEASLYMRNQLLRDTDWTSMAHSLEVRVPLVDAELLSQMAPVASGFRKGQGKRILSSSPKTKLPSAIVRRPKTGFCTPLRAWLARLPDAHSDAPWPRNWAQYVAKTWAN